jgi:gamma-butyrobetaine dioxygenase
MSDGTALFVLRQDTPAQPIHPLWLRERCSGAESLDARTGQRLTNPCELDPDIAIAHIRQLEAGLFEIGFSDGVESRFRAAEILAELQQGAEAFLPAPVPWRNDTPWPPTFDWPSCTSETAELAVLRAYHVHGYVILDDVPCRDGAVLEVARRFGIPRETNFGIMFNVRSEPEAIDLAYTSLALDPHTDNPYRTPVPGIQLLHCLTNETPGGLSTLVDGLAVAEDLRTADPAAFGILSRTKVRFRFSDAGTDLMAAAPLIELDVNGRFAGIRHSPRLDFPPLLPPVQMQEFYAARRTLDRMLRSSGHERRFRLADGQLMMFDNTRLLHGRTAFDPAAGLRQLQGCYIDADGPGSRYRVLTRRLA